ARRGTGVEVFFSSRRRHTRSKRDWSSDVCSSDLYGMTGDAYHITAPAENGEGGARAMAEALKDAEIEPDEVGYVNAHGTSTGYNDLYETLALKTVFGGHAPNLLINSTKSMTGHLLGATGAVEAIIASLSLQNGKVHPTINLTNPDPECDLN